MIQPSKYCHVDVENGQCQKSVFIFGKDYILEGILIVHSY